MRLANTDRTAQVAHHAAASESGSSSVHSHHHHHHHTGGAGSTGPTGTYVSQQGIGNKRNDPVYQGYSLTIPMDQTASPGPMQGPGGFSWQEPAANTSLWGSQGTPSIDDIKQGVIGDCYFDAAMGSVLKSGSPLGADAMKDKVKPDGNGGYNVQFYAKGPDGKATPVTINVNASELTDQAGNVIGNQVGKNGATWPQIMEKAYAIYAQKYPDNKMPADGSQASDSGSASYNAIDDHGADQASGDATIKGAMYALTGDTTTNTKVADASDKKLKDLLSQAGTTPVVANSKKSGDGVSAPHVYTVVGYDPKTDKVILRDPHGVNNSSQHDADGNGQFEISFKAFKDKFMALTTT